MALTVELKPVSILYLSTVHWFGELLEKVHHTMNVCCKRTGTIEILRPFGLPTHILKLYVGWQVEVMLQRWGAWQETWSNVLYSLTNFHLNSDCLQKNSVCLCFLCNTVNNHADTQHDSTLLSPITTSPPAIVWNMALRGGVIGQLNPGDLLNMDRWYLQVCTGHAAVSTV